MQRWPLKMKPNKIRNLMKSGNIKGYIYIIPNNTNVMFGLVKKLFYRENFVFGYLIRFPKVVLSVYVEDISLNIE